MVILLDTHILLWWLGDDKKLKKAERQLIASLDNVVYVSSATAWEIEIKRGLGKIGLPSDWAARVEEEGFLWLPITWQHTQQLSALPTIHRDPFDRMLVAQAKAEHLTLISYDESVRQYGVSQ
jgi:PIN domain nuclease of toxin-antitoxin system